MQPQARSRPRNTPSQPKPSGTRQTCLRTSTSIRHCKGWFRADLDVKGLASVRPPDGRSEKCRPRELSGLLDQGNEARRVAGEADDLNLAVLDAKFRQMGVVGGRFGQRLKN